MSNRCSLSTIETSGIEARWAVSPSEKVVRLTAFAVQHPYFASLQYVDPDELVDLEQVSSAISALNPGMTIDEATMVFSRQVDMAESREGEGWRVDTTLVDALLGDGDGR
jgi:hypothetical protein